MPIGFLIPSCTSITNSCGNTWSNLRSAAIGTERAAWITLSTSSCVTSWLLIGTIPLSFWHWTWRPEIDINTEDTLQSAINSISLTACLTDWTTRFKSFTPPLSIPRDLCVPTPIILMLSSSSNSPTIALITLVPMSKPTIRSLSVALDMFSFAHFNHYFQ